MGEGGRNAPRQGCLGRCSGPGAWIPPDLSPPRPLRKEEVEVAPAPSWAPASADLVLVTSVLLVLLGRTSGQSRGRSFLPPKASSAVRPAPPSSSSTVAGWPGCPLPGLGQDAEQREVPGLGLGPPPSRKRTSGAEGGAGLTGTAELAFPDLPRGRKDRLLVLAQDQGPQRKRLGPPPSRKRTPGAEGGGRKAGRD